VRNGGNEVICVRQIAGVQLRSGNVCNGFNMTQIYPSTSATRRALLSAMTVLPAASALLLPAAASAQAAAANDPLPSWNEGAAKQAIIRFISVTTDKTSPDYVPPEERIATFDQDGTLWVEQPMPSQLAYCFDQIPAVVAKQPELKDAEPFKTVLSGDREAIAKLPMPDLVKIVAATLTGMTTDEFDAEVRKWLVTAKDERWKRP
jgi:hypothetical protein